MSSAWTKPGPLGITWRSVVLHVATWAIFVALAALTAVGDDSEVDTAKDPPDLSILLQVPAAIYAAFLLYHFTARRGRHGAFLLGLALISTAYPYVASSLYEDPIFMQDDNYLQGAVNVLIIILLALGVRAGYNLVERTAELRTLRAERAEAQLSALRAQINPHFLFNSLNVLSALVKTDPARAEDFIQGLSTVYRYVLEVKGEQLVPLDRELTAARAYGELVGMRFGAERLRIDFDLEPRPGERIVPLALQMLLENAVKHNGATRRSPLHVRLTREGAEIVVRNNRVPLFEPAERRGIGLDNIRERYRLATGKDVRVVSGAEGFEVALPIGQTLAP